MIKNIGAISRQSAGSIWLAALLSVGLAGASWGSVASCSTKATLASFGATSTANGCYDIDKSFTDFSVTNQGTTGGGGATVQSGSTDDIQGTNTFSVVTSPWTVTAAFTPASTSNWSYTGSSGNHLEGTINYILNSSGAYIAAGSGSGQNPEYPTPSPGDSFVISSANLSNVVGVTSNSSGTDNSLVVTETFCAGTSACTVADRIVLTATFGDNDSTPTYACTVGTSSSATCGTASSTSPINVTLPNLITLNVTDQYNLVVHSNSTDTLSSFNNVWGETQLTPEPSAVLLLGVGLLGLVGLRLARRKSAAQQE